MPKILDGHVYQEMENELNNLFDQIYKHNKKNRTEIISQVQQFLDNLSESIRDHSRLLFTKISPEEIIYHKENKLGDSREKFQNLDKMTHYFNNLSALINFSVMQQEDPTLRVFYYDIYIQLMNFCYLKGDLFGAGAIYTGLIANNLPTSIDQKKLSSESRLIWDMREVELTRLFNLSTTYKAHMDLKEKLKKPFIPVLSSILPVQIYTKDAYDNSVSEHKRIQDGLRKLDVEHNKMLNRMQLESFSWSKPYYKYMKKVYLPQSIFEYTKLLSEYEELIVDHGGPIAKHFHQDKNSKPLVNFVESTLLENQLALKLSPFQNERIVAMLSEIDVVKSECFDLLQFDELSWKMREMNCTVVKAKSIGEYTSKIFANLDMPHMEGNVNEKPMSIGLEELRPEDLYQPYPHNGLKLMLELERAITEHKPTVGSPGAVNCGFFSRGKRGEKNVHLETMDLEIMEVDVVDHDENDLHDQTVMVLV